MPNSKRTVYYIYADASSIESGSIDGRVELLDNMHAAKIACEEGFKAMHSKVEKEISIIKSNPTSYAFESGYSVISALIEIPGSIETTEHASQWISQQLSDGEQLDNRIKMFDGFTIDAYRKTKLTPDALWQHFLL